MLTLEERKFMKSFSLAKRVELMEEVDFSKLDCYLPPDVKTSVHPTRSHNQSLFEWLLNGLKVCCCWWIGIISLTGKLISRLILSFKDLPLLKACLRLALITTISGVIELPSISNSQRKKVK